VSRLQCGQGLQGVRIAVGLTKERADTAPSIIKEALQIVENPARIVPETRPEAIALAYAMRTSPQLSTDIQSLTELQGIDKAIAGATLQLDTAFAA